MDTNLIELIIAIILFIAVLIFDFAFFRFRERKFEEGEPLSFLTQNTIRSLQQWANTMQRPKPGELPPYEGDGDLTDTDFATPARTPLRDTFTQPIPLEAVVAPAPVERPMVHVNISADVPEGTVVHITMQVTDADGKILVQNSTFTSKAGAIAKAPPAPRPQSRLAGWFVDRFSSVKSSVKSLNVALFLGAIAAYAIIISFGIDKWPIYFFTDEAIHMNMIADFLRNGLQNYSGEFLPTFFIKEGWVNGTSVYLQLLPYLIFGKSLIVTRLVSAFVTLLGATAIALLLKKVLNVKYYWVGLFLILTTPAFFLHARTAFEYAEVASFYCMFLYFYGRYRKGDMRSFYLAIVAAALCFYTHGLGQILTGSTGAMLFIIDFRYHIHRDRRKTILLGLVLAIILLLPFVRYYLGHPTEIADQVKRRNSYWSNSSLTTPEKMLEFLNHYFYGLNPMYWYLPNDIDFDRHIMVGPGIANGLMIMFPFMVIGFCQIFKTIRSVAQRLGIMVLIVIGPLLTSTFLHTFSFDREWRKDLIFPQIGPGTVVPWDSSVFPPLGLMMNILWPALVLTLIGLVLAFSKIRKPGHKLALVALLACPIPASVAAIGMPRMLWMTVPLAILTGIGLSAAVQWLEKRVKFVQPRFSAVGLFAVLVIVSLGLLRTALVDGPIWFQDYGLYGMQFGAKEVFQDRVLPVLLKDPNVNFVISPSWANGTEQFTDFFIPRDLQPRIRLGQPVDLMNDLNAFGYTQFVATAPEFNNLLQDPKFNSGIQIIDPIINYPNGQPGFYVITVKPADNIGEILNEQHIANRTPIEDTMDFNGQIIRVRHSPLGSGTLQDIFDNDPDTLSRVEEANPYYIDLYPTTPLDTHSVVIKTGSLHNYTITIRLYPVDGGQPVEYVQTYADEPGKEIPPDPEVTIPFDKGPEKASRIEIEIKDNLSGETSSIHLRTIQFK